MSLKKNIITILQKRPGLMDRELADLIAGKHSPQQPINIACRQLEKEKVLNRKRHRPKDNFIGNYLTGDDTTPIFENKLKSTKKDIGHSYPQEDELKKILVEWLQENGWETKVAWGNQRGVDITAKKQNKTWLIEVKGPGSRSPMRVNYFLSMLGELLQRMEDDTALYSIALPDIPQYRKLWDKLPKLAKKRTSISAIFVSSAEIIHLSHSR